MQAAGAPAPHGGRPAETATPADVPLTLRNSPFRRPCSHASGTPLSVLDPPGSATIEKTYKSMDAKIQVRRGWSARRAREKGGPPSP